MAFLHRDVRINMFQSLVCSGIAGLIGKTCVSPLDIVKIRLQVGTPEARNGVLGTFKNIWRTEGPWTFWRGNLLGCARILPFSFLQMAAFERLRLVYGDSCGRLNPTTAVITGAGAGMFATITTYPSDMVKTRLMVQNYGNKNNMMYKGVWDASKKILRNEGLFAFYRGLSATVIGSIPFGGAIFGTYEILDRCFGQGSCLDGSDNPVVSFISGCIAGAAGQITAFPFDTIRRKMQAINYTMLDRGRIDVTFHGMMHCFRKTVRKYGMKGLWRGCLPTLIKIVPYSGLLVAAYAQTKKVFLYKNGYTRDPFFERPVPHIDQSLHPHEVEEVNEYDLLLTEFNVYDDMEGNNEAL